MVPLLGGEVGPGVLGNTHVGNARHLDPQVLEPPRGPVREAVVVLADAWLPGRNEELSGPRVET